MVDWVAVGVGIGMVMYFIFPAYTANSFAVLVGGGMPMDGGRKLKDGRRILGDGKTWRGFAGGVLLAAGVGCIMNWAGTMLPADWVTPWSRGDWTYSIDWQAALPAVFLLCLGAMLGDALGSFIKRRTGIERGGKALLLDQLGFLVIALLLPAAVMPGWFAGHFIDNWRFAGLVFAFVVTPLIHRLINWVGYKMGAKKVPW
jgi:CDP-2,3-bis-(O-geranylgeranyl)-sn-glycerol synthase